MYDAVVLLAGEEVSGQGGLRWTRWHQVRVRSDGTEDGSLRSGQSHVAAPHLESQIRG